MGVLSPHILDDQTCPLQFTVRTKREFGVHQVRYRSGRRSSATYRSTVLRTYDLTFKGSQSQMASLVTFLDARKANESIFYLDNLPTGETDIKLSLDNPNFEPMYEKPEEASLSIRCSEVL